MTVVSKITHGVSPMGGIYRLLTNHRDEPATGLPVLPAGWCFLINDDDQYIINDDDNYIITMCGGAVDTSIIIDFLTVTATVGGVEVPIDTLMGSDPNTSPYTGPYPTLYDPANITTDGYEDENNYIAYIGAARDKIISGCTIVVQYKVINDWGDWPYISMGPDHVDPVRDTMITFTNHSTVWLEIWAVSGKNIISDCEPLTDAGDINRFAMTVTSTRAELAVNGDATTLFSYVFVPGDNPDALIAAMIDCSGDAIQRIEIYDPLPSTDGLVELSGG